MSNAAQLFLASASPRRAELLRQIGVTFSVCPTEVDESWLPGEPLRRYVERLAREKARSALTSLPTGSVVLAADTAGECAGRQLLKPTDEEDAVAMLMAMSGRAHTVCTAIAVACGNRLESGVVSSEVVFRPLGEAECRRYWASGEPGDKAGSYAIQGLGAVFVESIRGSYSAVVGLPLCETAQLLCDFGIGCWQTTSASTAHRPDP